MKKKIAYNYQLFFILSACLLLCKAASSQAFTEPSKLKQFNITVNYEEYTVKTQMLSQNKNVSVNNERVYMWYASQKLMETKGGYDGKLIHGTYRAFYLNNQLKEKGEIKYGLKHKEWKYWYADGRLREVINWKNGVKNGAYYLYNDYGQLMAKSNFKNDKLDGDFYTYGNSGNVIDKKKYKAGEEILQKVEQKKTRKFRLFNKDKNAEKQQDAVKPTEKKSAETKKEPLLKRLFKKKEKAEAPKAQPKAEKKKMITS